MKYGYIRLYADISIHYQPFFFRKSDNLIKRADVKCGCQQELITLTDDEDRLNKGNIIRVSDKSKPKEMTVFLDAAI